MKTNGKIWPFVRSSLAGAFFVLILTDFFGWIRFGKAFRLLQFAPSLLNSLALALPAAIVISLIVFLLTFIFGRVYCSVICPLGILQDIVLSVKALFRRKKRGPYHYYDTRTLKRAVFFFVAVLFCFGVATPLVMLLPSSNFFTILSNVFVQGTYQVAQLFGCSLDIKSVDPAPGVFITSIFTLIILIAMTLWKGRLYCNTLCPVGAVLSLPAAFSLFRIQLNQDQCVSCGMCEHVCKAGCIDAKNKVVRNENCVMCGNCLSACARDAIKLVLAKKSAAPKAEQHCDLSRRRFIAGIGGAAVGAGLGLAMSKLGVSRKEADAAKEEPSMPPGAMNRARFNAKCVGCGLCISKCTGNVLRAASLQYGLAGFMQPYMNYDSGFCAFGCSRCNNLCPTGALVPLKRDRKQSTRIGLAHFIPDNCVAYTAEQDCGACGEHCPVGAIVMVDYKSTRIPQINDKLCIGCGACQHICPGINQAKREPAIRVSGVLEQITVEKPVEVEAKTLKSEEDFPF